MSNRDEKVLEQLAKDSENFSKLLVDLQSEVQILDKLESRVILEISRAKVRVESLIRKLERHCDASRRHHKSLIESNKLWRQRELKKRDEPTSTPTAFFTVDSIIRLVYAISVTDTVRATDFEALSFSFLIYAVLERALTGESSGYILKQPLDIKELTEDGGALLRLLRESFTCSLTESEEVWNEVSPLVREWWKDVALPKIFGGSDPDWETDDNLPYDYMLDYRSLDPVYLDCLELIRCVKTN